MKSKNPFFEEFEKLFKKDLKEISSPYMMNRLISFFDILLSQKCNKFIGRIPNKLLILIYNGFIEDQKTPWVNYPKKLKNEEEEILKRICITFNCNMKYANQVLQIYKNNKINIKELYGIK